MLTSRAERMMLTGGSFERQQEQQSTGAWDWDRDGDDGGLMRRCSVDRGIDKRARVGHVSD